MTGKTIHAITRAIIICAIAAATALCTKAATPAGPSLLPTVKVYAAYELCTPTSQKFSDHYRDLKLGSRSGFSAGIGAIVPLGKNFFIEPGISIFESQISIDGYTWSRRGDYSFLWIFGGRINCPVGYRLDISPRFSLDFTTGPQLALGFSSGAHYPGKKTDNSLYTYGDGYIHRADFLWTVGLTANICSHFNLGVSFAKGLLNRSGITDSDPAPSPTYHRVIGRYYENFLSVSLAYTF